MITKFQNRPYSVRAEEALRSGGVLRPIARALAARGVTGPDDLCEDWTGMLSPAQLEGTGEAAKLLADLREKNGLVCVIADYDCDGATACALAVKGLSAMGLRVTFCIPDRFRFGYGLTEGIVDYALETLDEKPALILTVDNGVASVEGVKHAKELGINTLITDHHLQGDTLPDASCIVNPNMRTSAFASKALCGCGVMFYVLLALRSELRRRGIFTAQTQPNLSEFTDLVSLATVADVVALDKNNRILVSQGLKRVRMGRACPGLQALFAVAGRDTAKATVRDFAFAIAPRINAAGRLTKMDIGVACLLSTSYEEALAAAQTLEDLNVKRRELESNMQQEALDLVGEIDLTDRASIALFNEGWHQGVVGLVASRIKDRTNRPVIAFAPDDGGLIKGSGRSIEGIHLRDTLDLMSKNAPDLIERFGGHALAAGLTIRAENFERFCAEYEKAVRAMASPHVFDKTVWIDGALAPEEITFGLVDALASRIWGQGFERPVFANEFQVLSQRVLKDAHLKLILDLAGNRFDAIFFRHNTPLPSSVRLAYRPEINEFQGRRSVQLIVEAAEI